MRTKFLKTFLKSRYQGIDSRYLLFSQVGTQYTDSVLGLENLQVRLGFIEGKRRYLDCELHARLRQLVKRLRFERMWHVKNAWAEGRAVAPSLT